MAQPPPAVPFLIANDVEGQQGRASDFCLATEALRGEVTCPRSHSYQEEKQIQTQVCHVYAPCPGGSLGIDGGRPQVYSLSTKGQEEQGEKAQRHKHVVPSASLSLHSAWGRRRRRECQCTGSPASHQQVAQASFTGSSHRRALATSGCCLFGQ